jgi:hypothetical protein
MVGYRLLTQGKGGMPLFSFSGLLLPPKTQKTMKTS